MNHAGAATPWVVLSNRLLAGLTGGFVGGVAFGLLMQVTDILLMVAAMVGSGSTVTGWAVHLAISMLFGVLYTLALWRWVDDVWLAAAIGVVYGWTWWVLGGLLIMPAWLGRDDLFFKFNTTAWQSLGGHMLYGLVLGLVYAVVRARLDWRVRGRRADAPSPDAHTTAPERPAVAARPNGAAAVQLTSRGMAAARKTRRT